MRVIASGRRGWPLPGLATAIVGGTSDELDTAIARLATKSRFRVISGSPS